MALHVERMGRGRRIVLVHGFTQTGRAWGEVADELASDHEVLLVDSPGHGGSAEVDVDLVTGARLLAEVGAGPDRGAGPPTWIGYSMGGRWCLHVAVHHPAAVGGLVLLGATPGIEDADERAERRRRDVATADRLAEVGLDAFLEEWLAQPLFAGLPRDQAALDARRANTVAGLRSSLLRAGTGAQAPLWDRLGSITVPVLALAGEQDARYAALADRMAEAIGPSATAATVPGAGHAAHLEQPAAFLALVRPWLAAHDL